MSNKYQNHLGDIFVNIPDEGVDISDFADYGDIIAGFPSPALDYDNDDFDIENFLFGSPHKKVVFRVRGNSMIDAGIYEGDIAIVERGLTAKVGDIVIAFVDGQYSIKYLQKNAEGIFFLRPANKDYDDIYPEDELQIFGVVSSVIRRLKYT